MNDQTALTQRIQRLERDNRRLKSLFGVGFAVAAVTMLSGARFNAEPADVRVVDASGGVRARMAVDENDHAFIQHFDRNGLLRAFLGESNDGIENLTLYDEDGNPSIYLGFNSAGHEYLGMYDRKGTMRAFLGENSAGSENLTLYNSAGEASLFFGFADSGEANISLYDNAGTRRIFLGFSTSGEGNLTFYDTKGQPVQRYGE